MAAAARAKAAKAAKDPTRMFELEELSGGNRAFTVRNRPYPDCLRGRILPHVYGQFVQSFNKDARQFNKQVPQWSCADCFLCFICPCLGCTNIASKKKRAQANAQAARQRLGELVDAFYAQVGAPVGISVRYERIDFRGSDNMPDFVYKVIFRDLRRPVVPGLAAPVAAVGMGYVQPVTQVHQQPYQPQPVAYAAPQGFGAAPQGYGAAPPQGGLYEPPPAYAMAVGGGGQQQQQPQQQQLPRGLAEASAAVGGAKPKYGSTDAGFYPVKGTPSAPPQ